MAALLAGAAMAVPAAAQPVRNLDHEETNARVFNGVYNDKPVLFEVTLPAGQAMRVDVMSTSELDPYLKIYNAETGDLIAENDDGGEGLNSRAMVTATQDMHLRIAVSSYGARDEADGLVGTGEEIVEGGFVSGSSFDLKLTVLDYEVQPVRAVTWGSEEKGQFFGGEEHLYTITGEEGLLLEVAMIADPDDSSGLDPYLTLRDASGKTLAQNDDGGEGLNALLRYVMTGNETYTIVASGLGDSAGGYSLRVAPRREPIVQAPLQVVAIGDTATGRIGAGYENGDIDPSSLDYQLSESALAAISSGRAGEITVRMSKAKSEDADFGNGLDPYLELGFDTPLGFAVVQNDDDSAGDFNAMIPIDLSVLKNNPEMLSALRIKVKGYGESTGDYVLTVTSGLEPVDSEYGEYLESAIDPVASPPVQVQSSPMAFPARH
ncbi:hypothetical protein D2V17_00150 [Aurantiacibacter xanthus]|uniref:Peptidase C-terminal archaeal/bacterial domain-containing protein n=2 Tax=Aurantiacibacter xanthus TaxID=1784712 RepID=A0A3A1PHV3_9SPHN|nr:hypothetical protein D2V17_00150 [Aurantiacibacter xanthus]